MLILLVNCYNMYAVFVKMLGDHEVSSVFEEEIYF